MTTPFTPLSSGLYAIPKGQVLFKPEGSDAYELLGDTDAVELEIAVEETERFSNEDGERTKVLTVINQVDATLTMTLMQLTDRNRALSLLGALNYFTQAADTGLTLNIPVLTIGGIYSLNGDIAIDDSTIVVESGDAVPVAYVADVNYKLDKHTGLIEIVSKPLGADNEIDITYDIEAIVAGDKKARIGIASDTSNRGAFIYRGTNSQGPRTQLVIHDVQLRPSSPRALISDTDFAGIEIEGAVFKDGTKPAGMQLGWEQRLEQ
jgi:hypothetical protein